MLILYFFEKTLTQNALDINRIDHNGVESSIPTEIGDLTELRSFSFSESYSLLKKIYGGIITLC